MAPNVPFKRALKNPKNKKTKVAIVFDEKARKEYLTGFRKRKAERKKKYEEKMKKEIKSERKRMQVELRAKIKKSASRSCTAEVEHLVRDQSHIYETEEHTVTIEPITDTQYRDENVFLGSNKINDDESDTEAQTLEEKKKQEREMNRKIMKKLEKTKVVRRQVQAARDKSRKRSKKRSSKKK